MAQSGHSFKGRHMQIFCIILELIFDQFFFQGPGPPLILKCIFFLYSLYVGTRYINCLAEKVIKLGNLFFDLHHPIPHQLHFFSAILWQLLHDFKSSGRNYLYLSPCCNWTDTVYNIKKDNKNLGYIYSGYLPNSMILAISEVLENLGTTVIKQFCNLTYYLIWISYILPKIVLL